MKTKTVKLSLRKTTVKKLNDALRTNIKAGAPRLRPECCYNHTADTHIDVGY
jgi:hypothetical protein